MDPTRTFSSIPWAFSPKLAVESQRRSSRRRISLKIGLEEPKELRVGCAFRDSRHNRPEQAGTPVLNFFRLKTRDVPSTGRQPDDTNRWALIPGPQSFCESSCSNVLSRKPFRQRGWNRFASGTRAA
jgi:hypothetical protein